MSSHPLPELVSGVSLTDGRVPNLRSVPRAARPPKGATIRTRPATPEVWAKALELAGGDARRCIVEPDGSVIVANGRPASRVPLSE